MHGTKYVSVVVAVIGLCCLNVWAEVKPAGIFGDNMVLQRDIDVPVWGWGDVGEEVIVEFAGQKVSAKADADGKWMARLSPMSASAEGREMITRGPKNTVTFKNIVVGEVWICSGQSNMDWTVGGCLNASQEIAEANYPQIRQIAVARSPNVNLSKDTSGQWVICSPNSVGGFTAVGYFFGRDLFKALGVPVGLINSSWGGTHAETWTPQDTLRAKNINPGMVKFYDECVANFEAATKEYQEQVAKQERLKNEGKLKDRQEDPGNKGFEKGWAKADFDDTAWESIPLPRMCEFFQGNDGAAWFRRTVTIPDAWAGKDVKLCLGSIDDYDVTYFNGRQIGATDMTVSYWWSAPRIYTIPGKLVTSGRAVIAVRVFDDLMGGGFNGSAKDMKLVGSDGSLPLDGDWKYQVEVILSPDNLVRSIAPPPWSEQCQRSRVAVWRNDSPADSLRHSRRDLVSGGIQLRSSGRIRQSADDDDLRVAHPLGAGRVSVWDCAVGEFHGPADPAQRHRRLDAALRSPGGCREDRAQHRPGCGGGYRGCQRYTSQK